jgi:hypothetical protein
METSPVAWYAAALSSLVFVWDLTKWWRAEPRLRVVARSDVCFTDGEVISEEELPDGTKSGRLTTYCHVEIVNVGGRPTTLISVEVLALGGRGRGEAFAGSSNFKLHRGSEQLPAKLGPGEMWSARMDMRQLRSMEQFGPLHVRARDSWRNRPVEVRVRTHST